VAEEHEHGGTVIRGDDGAIYFIRPEILEMTKVTEPEMQAFCASLIEEHQSEVEGFALGSGVASLAFVGPFQAANYGFDKRAAVRLFGGLLTPDCNFLPPGMVGYTKIDPCPWGDPNGAPDLEKARSLIKEAGAEGAKVTVWGDDEERSKKMTEYYTDVLNKIGLKAKPKIIGAETYFDTIGNRKTNAVTMFDDWFQDFPHPADFFFLVEGKSIQPTHNQNHSLANDPEVNKLAGEIATEPAEKVEDKSVELDKLLTSPEKAYVIPYGHSHDTTFVSERMDLKNCTVYNPVYRDDWSQFCLK